MLAFPDIYHGQTVTDWAALRASTPIIAMKASQNGHADPKFHANREAAIEHEFEAIIMYDYLMKSANPAASAKSFLKIVGPLDSSRDLPTCDLEEGVGDQSARLDLWNNTIPGDTELDYSGLSFWLNQLSHTNTYAATFHRWIAAYRNRAPSTLHLLWQRADNQQFPGISAPCDGNVFDGTIDDFKRATGLISGTPDKPIVTGKNHIHIPPFSGEFHKGDKGPQIAALKVYLCAAGYTPDVRNQDIAETYDNTLEVVAYKLQRDHDVILFLGKDGNTADYWINQPPNKYSGTAFGPKMWAFLGWLLLNK